MGRDDPLFIPDHLEAGDRTSEIARLEESRPQTEGGELERKDLIHSVKITEMNAQNPEGFFPAKPFNSVPPVGTLNVPSKSPLGGVGPAYWSPIDT